MIRIIGKIRMIKIRIAILQEEMMIKVAEEILIIEVKINILDLRKDLKPNPQWSVGV